MSSKRTKCPDCLEEGKTKNNVGVYEDGKMYCFRCEKVFNTEDEAVPLVPFLNTTPVPLPSRGIYKEIVEAFKAGASDEKPTRLVFPYFYKGKLASQKAKNPKTKGVEWINHSKKLDLFGEHLHDASRKNIIITEGEEDALAVYQSLGTGAMRSSFHVTSLHGGAGSVGAFISEHYQRLASYDFVIVCFDEDEAGQKARDKALKMFSRHKLKVAKLPLKDASDMLAAGQEEELKWAVVKADLIRPKGMICVGDLDDSYFDYVFPKGETLPFPMLQKATNGLRRGELTMIAAGSGIGKSTFVANIVYDFVIKKKLKIVDIRLEENDKKTVYSYAKMFFEDPELADNAAKLTHEQRVKFKEAFKTYYTHNHFGSLESKELLSLLEYYALVEKVDFIFLDHISIAISGNTSSNEGERKDIDILLTKIRELINLSNVGFVCVTHVSRPTNKGLAWEEGRRINRDSLRGSGSLAQIPDNIWGIEGNIISEDETTKNTRQIRSLKARYASGQETLCDSYLYNHLTGKVTVTQVEIIQADAREVF